MLELQVMSKVSAIIINYNGAQHLDDCLSSLLAQDYEDLEIIVVDNLSTDNSLEIIEKYKEVKTYIPAENYCIARPTNEVAKTLDSKYILVLNNDLKFFPDCVSKAVEEMKKDPDCFSVDVLQYNWDGDTVVRSGQMLKKCSFLKGVFPGIDFTQDLKYHEIFSACAGSMLIDREKFMKLGGFDNNFFIEMEDIDICLRATMCGWKNYFCKESKLYHKVLGSLGLETFKGSQKSLSSFTMKRKTSLRFNLFRLVIKACDLRTISLFALIEIFRIIYYLLTGKFALMKIHLAAFVQNIQYLPDTLKERSFLMKNAKYTWAEIRDKYLVD